MPDRLAALTYDARHVLALAREEAERLRHTYIGTEHLLLGILRRADPVAARALAEAGVELEAAREAVVTMVGWGPVPVAGGIGLTPLAWDVVRLAEDEARRVGSPVVGCTHLLAGLVGGRTGIACGVLAGLGVDLGALHRRVAPADP
jgi:ATP-dependent Clp protease ATP-binding subunit ClpC